MKNQEQIEAKIKEHEDHIEGLLSEDVDDLSIYHIEAYLQGRKALQWVLSDETLLPGPDEFEKRVRYEMMCFEAGKIF